MPRRRRRPRASLEHTLVTELRRLQGLGLGKGLRGVVADPAGRAEIEAEVYGDVVRVYVQGRRDALGALRHEVIHHEIAGCSVPYLQTLNAVLRAVNEDVYRRQERLSDLLAKLVEE